MSRSEIPSASRSRRESRRRMRWLAHRENAQRQPKIPLPVSADIAVERIKITPLQKRVRGFLEAAYARNQRAKLEPDPEVAVFSKYYRGGQSLLRAFKQSQDFEHFYQIAITEAGKGNNREDEFRGALFQSLAFAYLRETMQDPTKVLLSPKDTTKLAQIANPGVTTLEHPYGLQALSGRSVPDFLILGIANGQVVIDAFGEISLSTDPDKYVPQIRGFSYEKSRLGQIAKLARFKIITPSTGLPLDIRAMPGMEHVDREFIPLGYPGFTRFAEDIEKRHRISTDSPTLHELRRQAQLGIQQIRRIGEPQFFRK